MTSHTTENTPTFDLEEMMTITRRLSELVGDDMTRLKSMRIGKLNDTHEEKLQLANLLEGYKNALKANPELLRTFSQEAINKAREEAKTFETKLHKSHDQLRKAHTAHGAVLELIRSVVREKSAPVRSYGKNGSYPKNSQNHTHTPPINLDERI